MQIFYEIVGEITGTVPKTDLQAKAELHSFLAKHDAINQVVDKNDLLLLLETSNIYAEREIVIPIDVEYYFQKEKVYQGPEGIFTTDTESSVKIKFLNDLKNTVIDHHIDLEVKDDKKMVFYRETDLFYLNNFKLIRTAGLIFDLTIIDVDIEEKSMFLPDKFQHTKSWTVVKYGKLKCIKSEGWNKGQLLEVLADRAIINITRQ